MPRKIIGPNNKVSYCKFYFCGDKGLERKRLTAADISAK
jgi:hypothetical protein